MELWTLLENTSCREDVIAQHGLSLYIETGTHRILFDSGPSDALIRNAEVMGIDLSSVDLAVLSHGHYDHGGGLRAFLAVNDHAPVYVNQNVFHPYYHGPEKYIGLDPWLQNCERLIPVGDFLDLGDGLTLHSCNQNSRPYPAPAYGLTIEEQGQRHPDAFLHEQYLLVEENGKRILFSGCSHKGILNIESWFTPDVLLGGFHLKKLDPAGDGQPVLREIAEKLLEFPTLYYTGHCTGTEQYEFLKTLMGDRLGYFPAGSHISL